MGKMVQFVFCCCLVCIAVPCLDAAPLPPTGPVDIIGIVSDLQWQPEKRLRGLSGMSGSAGHNRVIPEHFLVVLRDYAGIDAETARRMSFYLDGGKVLKDEGHSSLSTHVLVRINYNDRNFLVRGRKLQISGYEVTGDEGGTWTSYRSIVVLSEPPVEGDAVDFQSGK